MYSNLKFRLVKIADIIFITALYVISGILASIFIDKLFVPFQEEHGLLFQYIILVLEISFILIIIYVIRNIVVEIPSPFDGMAGLVHQQVKEINGGIVLGLILFIFTPGVNKRIVYFRNGLVSMFKA